MPLQGVAAAELKVIVHLRVLLSLCGWSCSSCGNPCSCIAPRWFPQAVQQFTASEAAALASKKQHINGAQLRTSQLTSMQGAWACATGWQCISWR